VVLRLIAVVCTIYEESVATTYRCKKAEPLLTPPCKIGCYAISDLPSPLAGAAFSGHHAADALAE
jgi:hypothetical protein